MTQTDRRVLRYSISFKQKVVNEIESGSLTFYKARELYKIGGGSTIQQWVRTFGKNHLLNKVVRIEMKDEKDRVKQLELEIRRLKIALADAHLEKDVFKTIIELAEKEGIVLKKSIDGTVSES